MPKKGDLFEVTLKETHVAWGEYRHTNTRDLISGETYIPIPRSVATDLEIFNRDRGEGIGHNEYYAKSLDGYYEGIVKMSGNQRSGDPYAKNIAESGNLKGFNEWFNNAGITVGTRLRIEWISSTELLFTKL